MTDPGFSGRTVLVTPRLALRDFTLEDLPAYLEHQADPRHTEFYGPGETGPDFTRSLVERFVQWAAEVPRRNYQLAVVLREGAGELIGSCGVRLHGCEAGKGDFGLGLAPRHWGRGFATEAARAILEFGFRELGLQEIRGVTVTENSRVQRLVARLGFTKVETIPGLDWMSARGWSQSVWRLRAGEWSSPGQAHSQA